MNFRAYLARQKDREKPLLIDQLIEKRAIYCIQDFWRNYKMKRRLKALSEISRIITPSAKSRPIDSAKIYIEKNIYMNIERIMEKVKRRPRFHEQFSSFMFAEETLWVNPHPLMDGVIRYPDHLSCPDWFILDLFKCPKYHQKPLHINDPLSLFHYATAGFGEIKRYNDIVDYNQNAQLVDSRNLYFLEVHCRNVEEARKRVCILAYLTFDNCFVKMFSKSMLEDPFFFANIRK